MNARAKIAVDATTPADRSGLAARLSGFAGVELAPEGQAPRAELTLMAAASDPVADIGRAARLLETGQAREVILLGAAPAPEILLSAMRAGVAEYLPEPLLEADLMAAVERLRRRRGNGRLDEAPAGQGRVTLVLGAKGGIGATTLAVNLADALARQSGGRTVLLDLAPSQGDAALFLDLEYSYTWADVAANVGRLDATYLESLLARHRSGLAVLPAPAFGVAHGLDPDALRRVLEIFRQGYANVVIDAGAGSGHDEAVLEALEQADDVLLVLDLSLPCLARAKRLLDAVRSSSPQLAPKIRLVANRKTSESDIGAAEAEEILRQPIAWSVLNDYRAALSAINQGKTLCEADPRSGIARGITVMARELCRQAPEPPQPVRGQGSLWARLRQMPLGLSLAGRSA